MLRWFENIILGGLGVQILFFGGFIVTTFIFQVRMHRYYSDLSST